MWSKVKRTRSAEETQSERKAEPEELDNVHNSDSDEMQYPGFKVVLPTVLSVYSALFLAALVSLLSHPPRIMIYDRSA